MSENIVLVGVFAVILLVVALLIWNRRRGAAKPSEPAQRETTGPATQPPIIGGNGSSGKQPTAPAVQRSFCPYCGKMLEETSVRFCPYCGKPME